MAKSTGSTGRGVALHSKILLGLGVGALLGGGANFYLGGTHPWVEGANHYVAGPVGQIYLRLLLMVVMPLVFAAMSLGVVGLGNLRKVGRVGTKAVAYFASSTVLAAGLGLLVVLLVRPGERISPETRSQLMATYGSDASTRVGAGATRFGVDAIVNVVPRNPFRAAVDLDLLSVLFFSIVFGAALTLVSPARAKPMVDWLQSLHDVAAGIVSMSSVIAPYGVACLMFSVTSHFGFDVLRLLGWYVAAVLGALVAHVLLTLSAVLRFAVGISPLRFYSRCRDALVTAFSTSSSNATLPTALTTAEFQLGIPPAIAGFVLPLGGALCMNGTALFEGMTVLTLAQAFGVPFGLGEMSAVMLVCVITSVGAAGVPGGSIPLLVAVLLMFGIPGEGIALILGVDRILDMSRTCVNVCGDLTATALIARTEKVWDASMLPEIEESRLVHA